MIIYSCRTIFRYKVNFFPSHIQLIIHRCLYTFDSHTTDKFAHRRINTLLNSSWPQSRMQLGNNQPQTQTSRYSKYVRTIFPQYSGCENPVYNHSQVYSPKLKPQQFACYISCFLFFSFLYTASTISHFMSLR